MRFIERAATTMAALGSFNVDPNFRIAPQDAKLENGTSTNPGITAAGTTNPPLGPIAAFSGNFAGTGMNFIFRPNSGGSGGTTFPNPISPPAPQPPSENVLEINLMNETLSFGPQLGSVPNRGEQNQGDIFLNGVSYVQVINDVTNPVSGRNDGTPSGIHFEPGLWMHVPATNNNPVLGETLSRMASIPHGTTINAQALSPSGTTSGAPTIPSANLGPFPIGNPSSRLGSAFCALNATTTNCPRLPQDLTKFIQSGSITQAHLNDPNLHLRNANKGKTITSFTTFTVMTSPSSPVFGGGAANIAFLEGANGQQNANATDMSATFWIETLSWKLTVPAGSKKNVAITLSPAQPFPGAQVPSFVVTPPQDVTTAKVITVSSTQIQYSQNVNLDFFGLTWPHISVNTLTPITAIPVPASAFN